MRRRLTLADVSRQPPPGLDHPEGPGFSPDGGALTYLQSADRTLVRSLWWHDLQSGARHEILAPANDALREEQLSHEQQLERQRRHRAALGVTSATWSTAPGSRSLVARSGAAIFAWRGTADDEIPALRALPAARGAASAILSPGGDQLAFVVDDEVWVCPLPAGEARRLTHDAGPGRRNGLAEYAAAEELDRHDGLWWSADGRSIACAVVDEHEVPEFTISHFSHPEPSAETHRYPFAGGPNARVGLRIVPAGGGEPVPVALPMEAGDYLARVIARPGDGWLVGVLPRGQRMLRWTWLEPDGTLRPAWEEAADPWINLDTDTEVLDDGRVLRTTERSGYRHLELRAPDGTLDRQLTAGPWVVTGVVHVDEAAREVLFTGTHDGVTERHLYATPLDAEEPVRAPRRLTTEPGWHAVIVSRDGARWVDTWSSLRTAPRVIVRARDATRMAVIHEPPATAEGLGLAVPALIELTAADGETPIWGAVYRPKPATDSPPPGVLVVYGGPHAQRVKDAWEVTVTMARQYLCAAGAAVVAVDNRGSANRGLAFEAPLAGRFGEVEVEDQVAALEQLGERGEVDLGRVAVTGGSYGGYMTIRLMTHHPALFTVGVAVAPVTAWDGYDTAYTERYLGRPDEAETAYRASSLLAGAGSAIGDLLIIHGEADENVHLRHSMRFLAALSAGGRTARFTILPDARHQVRGAALAMRERCLIEHLVRGLGLRLGPDG